MELYSVPVPEVSVNAVALEEDARERVSSLLVFLLEGEVHDNGVLLDIYPDGVVFVSAK